MRITNNFFVGSAPLRIRCPCLHLNTKQHGFPKMNVHRKELMLYTATLSHSKKCYLKGSKVSSVSFTPTVPPLNEVHDGLKKASAPATKHYMSSASSLKMSKKNTAVGVKWRVRVLINVSTTNARYQIARKCSYMSVVAALPSWIILLTNVLTVKQVLSQVPMNNEPKYLHKTTTDRKNKTSRMEGLQKHWVKWDLGC